MNEEEIERIFNYENLFAPQGAGRPADDGITTLREVCNALTLPEVARSLSALPAARHTESFEDISARGRRDMRRVARHIVTAVMERVCPGDPYGLWRAVDEKVLKSDYDCRAMRLRDGGERALRVCVQALSQLPNRCPERDVLSCVVASSALSAKDLQRVAEIDGLGTGARRGTDDSDSASDSSYSDSDGDPDSDSNSDSDSDGDSDSDSDSDGDSDMSDVDADAGSAQAGDRETSVAAVAVAGGNGSRNRPILTNYWRRKARIGADMLMHGLRLSPRNISRSRKSNDVLTEAIAFMLDGERIALLSFDTKHIKVDGEVVMIGKIARRQVRETMWEEYDAAMKAQQRPRDRRLQRTLFLSIVERLTHTDQQYRSGVNATAQELGRETFEALEELTKDICRVKNLSTVMQSQLDHKRTALVAFLKRFYSKHVMLEADNPSDTIATSGVSEKGAGGAGGAVCARAAVEVDRKDGGPQAQGRSDGAGAGAAGGDVERGAGGAGTATCAREVVEVDGKEGGQQARGGSKDAEAVVSAGGVGRAPPIAHVCPLHCRSFALGMRPSDGTRVDGVCADCNAIIGVYSELKEIASTIDEPEQRKMYMDAVAELAGSTFQYMGHLLRTAHQTAAIKAIVDGLGPDCAHIIIDFKMKWLPLEFREKQTSFFGKRGNSWHGVAVLIRRDGQIHVYYVDQIIDNDDKQDAFAVASCIEAVLLDLKLKFPDIKSVSLQSDNANCYASNVDVGMVFALGIKHGLPIVRYINNEAGEGKDLVDQHFGVCGRLLRMFVASGKDCATPEQIIEGLRWREGLHNSYCYLVTLDEKLADQFSAGSALAKFSTVAGISGIRDLKFDYVGDCVTAWEYSGITPGVRVDLGRVRKWVGSGRNATEPTLTGVAHTFPSVDAKKRPQAVPKAHTKPMSQRQLQRQRVLDEEAKKLAKAELSLCDKCHGVALTAGHAKRCHGANARDALSVATRLGVAHITSHGLGFSDLKGVLGALKKPVAEGLAAAAEAVTQEQITSRFIAGWARRPKRSKTAWNPAVEKYIDVVFNEVETGRKKVSPQEMMHRLRSARGADGALMFSARQMPKLSAIRNRIKRLVIERKAKANRPQAVVDTLVGASVNGHGGVEGDGGDPNDDPESDGEADAMSEQDADNATGPAVAAAT